MVHEAMARFHSRQKFYPCDVMKVHRMMQGEISFVEHGGCSVGYKRYEYYIGICCSPWDRWTGAGGRGCHKDLYDKMIILAAGDGPCITELEKDLIAKELGQPGCRNKGRGGERRAPRGTQVFLYVCVRIIID